MIQETYDFAAGEVVRAFGEEVLYNSWPAPAIFGSGFVAVQGGEVRLSSRRPELMVRYSDLPNPFGELDIRPQEGDQVEVRGQEFEVTTIRPDVEDVSAVLVLKKV